MNDQDTVIFVYNADSSIFSQLTDYLHKIISPQTYECNLCKLTYDNLGMKKEWKSFIQSLPLRVSFLHRDEFRLKFPDMFDKTLPTILIEKNGKVAVLLSTKEIRAASNISQLKAFINNKLSKP